jgi:uncharacterized protein (DUF1697 family)
MTKYAAFLRGINVGGGRIIKMAELKDCLEKAGLKDVKTFIASGNVIFSDSRDKGSVAGTIESTIEKRFGFTVDVLVMDESSLARLVKAIPGDWVNDKTMKCDVMMLWPGIDDKSIVYQLLFTPGLEDYKYVPGAVIWRADRDKAAKSKLYKIVGTKLYKQMTIRNPNTMRKIYTLMEAE